MVRGPEIETLTERLDSTVGPDASLLVTDHVLLMKARDMRLDA